MFVSRALSFAAVLHMRGSAVKIKSVGSLLGVSSKVVSKYPEMKVVMDAFVEMQGADAEKFSNMTGKIEPIISLIDNIIDDIKQKRNQTQAALEQVCQTFEEKSEALKLAVEAADTDWNNCFDCSQDLISLRDDYETSRGLYDQTVSNLQIAEQVRDEAKHISDTTGSQTFSCNLLHDASLCSQDRADFQSTVNNATNQTLQGIATQVNNYTILNSAAVQLRQQKDSNDTARKTAYDKWYDHTGTCETKYVTRQEKVCHVGPAYDSKCQAHEAYVSLKARITGTGHDESDDDRASEWSVAKKVKCILERWSTDETVNIDTTSCLGLNYSIEVGNINFTSADTDMNNLLTEVIGEQNHKFDCQVNDNMQFGGGEGYSPRPRPDDFDENHKPNIPDIYDETYQLRNRNFQMDRGVITSSSGGSDVITTFSDDLYDDKC